MSSPRSGRKRARGGGGGTAAPEALEEPPQKAAAAAAAEVAHEDVAPHTPTAGSAEATAVVEHARSSRSTCRVCGERIAQGELRLGCAPTRIASSHACRRTCAAAHRAPALRWH
jgi:hypothetical protein